MESFPFFGISIRFCNQIVNACLWYKQVNRIRPFAIVRSRRHIEMFPTKVSSKSRDTFKIHFRKQEGFSRQVNSINTQRKAFQVTMIHANRYWFAGIDILRRQTQPRQQDFTFFILQSIDSVVLRISLDSLPKQSQSFCRIIISKHPARQTQIHLRTYIQVTILLHPFTELFIVGLRICIKSSQEPCRAHTLYLIYM